VDLAPQKFTPGTYTFYLIAQSQVKYERKSAGGKGDAKKQPPADAPAAFYSSPITLKVLPK
jgi:hypothetical protein